ncbi:hypothetical protein JOC61_000797 [Marinitoga litoralis]|nr:hypothetical protein [Marinitoga litoralis]
MILVESYYPSPLTITVLNLKKSDINKNQRIII